MQHCDCDAFDWSRPRPGGVPVRRSALNFAHYLNKRSDPVSDLTHRAGPASPSPSITSPARSRSGNASS